MKVLSLLFVFLLVSCGSSDKGYYEKENESAYKDLIGKKVIYLLPLNDYHLVKYDHKGKPVKFSKIKHFKKCDPFEILDILEENGKPTIILMKQNGRNFALGTTRDGITKPLILKRLVSKIPFKKRNIKIGKKIYDSHSLMCKKRYWKGMKYSELLFSMNDYPVEKKMITKASETKKGKDGKPIIEETIQLIYGQGAGGKRIYFFFKEGRVSSWSL